MTTDLHTDDPPAVVSGDAFVEVRQLADPALDIWVPGKAQPKGSKTMVHVGQGPNRRTIQIESADLAGKGPNTRKVKNALADWSQAIQWYARSAWGAQPALDGPVHVVAEFRMERTGSFRLWHSYRSTKPDVDKLLRAALDALKAADVIFEDSRAVTPWPIKRLCEKGQEPGVRIRVWPLGEWEAAGWILHIPDHPLMVPKAGAA